MFNLQATASQRGIKQASGCFGLSRHQLSGEIRFSSLRLGEETQSRLRDTSALVE